jgi:protein O-GlcNAc transferase
MQQFDRSFQEAQGLHHKGKSNQAQKRYEQILQRQSNHGPARLYLSILLFRKGQIRDALENAHQAIRDTKKPDSQMLFNYGVMLKNTGQLEQAKIYLQRAEEIGPPHTELFLHHAQICKALNEDAPAYKYLKKVFQREPAHREAWRLLQTLDPSVWDPDYLDSISSMLVKSNVQCAATLTAAIDICRKNLAWAALTRMEEMLVPALDKPLDHVPGSFATFTLLGANVPQETHLKSAKATWKGLTSKIQPLPPRQLSHRKPGQKIRVAIMSSDLSGHAGGTLLVGLLENLSRENIEWYAYSNSFDDNSRHRKRIRGAFDRFINVFKLSDDELAHKIREDEIDILIDRNGMTRDTRVLVTAFHPAPVQMTYLAMPGSVGAEGDIDYIFADPWVIYEGNIHGLSESVIQLPRCYQPNDHIPPDTSIAGTRAEHNLPEDAFVFCCFNQHYKFSPDNFALWCRILNQAPNSVLWLMKPETKAIENQLRKNLQKNLIAPDRLILGHMIRHDRHLARLSHADLILDTWPYNAHTTASDALRVGVPVVTIPGRTFASRVAASILDFGNLPEWITNSPEEFVNKAVQYASKSRQEIRAVKEHVHKSYWNSSMVDNKTLSREFEALLLQVYDRAAAGDPPRDMYLTRDLKLKPLNIRENAGNSGIKTSRPLR